MVRHRWTGEIEMGDAHLHRRRREGASMLGMGALALVGYAFLRPLDLFGNGSTLEVVPSMLLVIAIACFSMGIIVLLWRTRTVCIVTAMDQEGRDRWFGTSLLESQVEGLLRGKGVPFQKGNWVFHPAGRLAFAATGPHAYAYVRYTLPKGLRLVLGWDRDEAMEQDGGKYSAYIKLERIRVASAPLAREVQRTLDELPKLRGKEISDED